MLYTLIILISCSALAALATTVTCIVLITMHWKIGSIANATPFQSIDDLLLDLENTERCHPRKFELINIYRRIRFYFLIFFVISIALILITVLVGVIVKFTM